MVGAVITKEGKNEALKLLYGKSTKYVNRFSIGTGTTDPQETDTDLESKITGWNNGNDFNYFMTGYPIFLEESKEVVIRGIVESNQANGQTIAEVGEYFIDGTLFSRDTINPIEKNDKIRLIIEWRHNIV